MDATREPTQLDVDRRQARAWVLLAALSLMLAGGLAALLVVARTPGMDRVVGDPLFFKRVLVVHVDLSMDVWFCAFIAGLFSLLPVRGGGVWAGRRRLAPAAALGAMLLLVAVGMVPGIQPVLSNYVPMLDHPLYGVGLLLFALAVLAVVADARVLPRKGEPAPALLPAESTWSLRAAGLTLLLAGVTFAEAWVLTPHALSADTYYELLYWGGGHVLQFANAAAMVACWLALLTPVLGRSPLSHRQAAAVAGLMLAPALLAPVLGLMDPVGGESRVAFTRLMQWGIFPGVLLALALVLRGLVQARREGQGPGGWRLWAFAASAGLTLLGFLLGALIRGSNTMVPAHYHAAIGGVTVSFMAVAYGLLEPLGMPVRSARLWTVARWQPVVYGLGQALFASGLALAGAHGMGRKAYGAEQVRRTFAETLGMGVMSLGGLGAIVGGALFVWVMLVTWRAASPRRAPAPAEALLPKP